MKKIEEHTHLIEQEIAKLSFPEKPVTLYEPMRYILSLGGKRMRPVLLLMGNELFGGDPKKVIPQALAIELLHNFTLIHDDIMDRAPLRRGKETVHKKWNESIAILAGDAMMVKAYQLLSTCDAEKFYRIHEIFSRTAVEICEGQQFDMEFESRDDVKLEEYIEMIGLKTSVLLGAALEIGAMLAGANDNDADHLYEFGKHLGIAFQLQDDLLDAFGDPEKFGKQTGGDILANKKTYLHLVALRDADEKQHSRFQMLMTDGKINPAEKVATVLSLYETLQVKEKTRKEMDHHFEIAKSHLDNIALSAEQKLPLLALAEQLMVRAH